MRRAWFGMVVGLVLAVGAQAAVPPRTINGRVVGVTDGDTLRLLTADHHLLRVRLTEIDAPEHDQPWGQRAKQALSALAFGRNVRVVTPGQDRYGRTLGRIYVGDQDVNAALVRQGAAWAYRDYLTDRRFLGWEAAARGAHLGLWGNSASATPPWDWRRAERHPGAEPRRFVVRASALPPRSGSPERSPGAFSCESKRYCREMTSCAEARFYLARCGLHRLDGDGDGVPCESLCR